MVSKFSYWNNIAENLRFKYGTPEDAFYEKGKLLIEVKAVNDQRKTV